MIQEYFNSPSENFIKFYENLALSSFGKNIDVFGFSENDLSNLDKYDIAIFYLNDVKESESVIKRIYSLEYGNWNLKILDLGVFKKGNEKSDNLFAIKSIINKLSNYNIFSIVVGGQQSDVNLLCKSLGKDFIDVVSVDKNIGIGELEESIESSNYLSKLIVDDEIQLNNFSNIGFLKHTNNFKQVELIEKFNFEALSLGQIRADIGEVEPITRNSTIINFSLESLQSSIINYKLTSPNGLSAHEACIISKMSGQSIDSKIVAFNNIKQTLECHAIVSEMLWYCVEGFNNRYTENFNNLNDFKIYHTEFDGHNLKFLKNNITQRWWIEYVDDSLVKINKDFIPCSERDFLESKKGIISDRILKRMRNKFA